jgi:hypothetical protein
LEVHLREHVYVTVEEIVAYVQERYAVAYIVNGMPDRYPSMSLTSG